MMKYIGNIADQGIVQEKDTGTVVVVEGEEIRRRYQRDGIVQVT